MPTASGPVVPNLTNIAYFARIFIKYGTFLLIFLIIGRIVLNISYTVYMVLNPPKPPGPTNGFGTLPPLVFPPSNSSITSYSLQTKDGGFPVVQNQMRVYFMPLNKATLFSLDQSKQTAASLGYIFAPEQFSSVNYRWKKTTPLPATLEIDIVNQSLKLALDWASDPNFLSQKSLPQSSNAQLDAKNILRNANLLAADMATAEARVTFLKAVGTEFAPAVSQSEADFLRVDVFRNPILQKFPILRSDPTLGNARIIFSGNPTTDEKIVEMQYMHYPIEYEGFETYRLITPAEAWAQLQAGKGYVALVDEGTVNAVVRGVYLAYYDSDSPQNYLQPIYVFTGDNNFYGYVSAVAPLVAAPQR